MFKLMIVGRRRGGMTLAALRHHLLEVHGPMVLRGVAQQPAESPQRYVQNHVFDGSGRALPSNAPAHGIDPFALNRDFVTQVWFANPAQAAASLQTAFYREQLVPDEERFVELASVVKWPVAERVLHEAPVSRGTAKLFVFLQCAPTVALPAFAAAADALSAALRDLPGGAAITRHVCNESLRRPGEEPPVDRIDELWFDSHADTAALAAALPDEIEQRLVAPGLVAAGTSFMLLADEFVLHAGGRRP